MRAKLTEIRLYDIGLCAPSKLKFEVMRDSTVRILDLLLTESSYLWDGRLENKDTFDKGYNRG